MEIQSTYIGHTIHILSIEGHDGMVVHLHYLLRTVHCFVLK